MSETSAMTTEQCRRSVRDRLAAVYGATEAGWLTRMIFEHVAGYSTVDLAIKADEPLSDFMAGHIDAVVHRLLAHEPIQYIFGDARFCGLTLKVTPDTLIPRPETEQLVDMITDEAGDREDLDVLDIATGSGCIAIALARSLRFAHVRGTDISDKALEVARANAVLTRTRVDFVHADALKMEAPAQPQYDIIVSNPPYIAQSERAEMPRNVTEHEPALALFVPDDDPLEFYHAICRYAAGALRQGGRLYFELNPLFADRLVKEMTGAGGGTLWSDVELRRDMRGLVRFLTATRSKQ